MKFYDQAARKFKQPTKEDVLQSIKPIQTIYKGYKFRSRLEARWAVFFDNLQIPYQYEKEGFDIDGYYYLPDFWLPTLSVWVEIKPLGWQYSKLLETFSHINGGTWVFNIFGEPYLYCYGIVPYKKGADYIDSDNPYVFATDRRDKGVIWIENNYVWVCLNEKTDHDRFPLRESNEIMKGYAAARQARFEHGEKP
jgi:hypothetical protein